MRRPRTFFGLTGSDQAEMLAIETVSTQNLGMTLAGEVLREVLRMLFRGWCPRYFTEPRRLNEYVAQYGYWPLLVTAGYRKFLLTYDNAAGVFGVLKSRAIYPHMVLVHEGDATPERLDEIGAWLRDNVQPQDYQHMMVVRIKRDCDVIGSWPSFEKMLVTLRENDSLKKSIKKLQRGRPRHFSGSVFCFKNLNDALLFKLRWVG